MSRESVEEIDDGRRRLGLQAHRLAAEGVEFSGHVAEPDIERALGQIDMRALLLQRFGSGAPAAEHAREGGAHLDVGAKVSQRILADGQEAMDVL